jgi:AcrR family transcriptional regulator
MTTRAAASAATVPNLDPADSASPTRRRTPRRTAGPGSFSPQTILAAPRPVGRPRSGTADRAILDAAMALLSEVGLAGLTMSAVVARSRVARATVYRRYPTREALIAAALAQVKGREPFVLSGDIEADIATGVVWAAAVLGEAPFQRFLPLFVSESLRGPLAAHSLLERVTPNHGGIAREYAAQAAEAGFRTDIDPTLVSDIVQGAMLMRLLSTGTPPDATAVQQLVDVLLRGLRSEVAFEAPASQSA